MSRVLAFDVYGTLVDPQAIGDRLRSLAAGRAADLASLWRSKQLEYSFRRGLMGAYADFDVCTRDALAYACAALGLNIGARDKQALLEAYRHLPAYPETAEALIRLKRAGHRLLAFSNGTSESVAAVLEHAGMLGAFDDVVSVHAAGSFKPDPAVYRYFEQQVGEPASPIYLVSANPFDIVGAINVGWQTVWVRRDPSQPFDPWGGRPTAEVSHLGELGPLLSGQH